MTIERKSMKKFTHFGVAILPTRSWETKWGMSF
jgi:hypothetical protein